MTVSSHLFLFTVYPDPLPISNVRSTLDFIIKIKPTALLKKNLLSVSNIPVSPDKSEEETLIEIIDTSIEVIFHYFSASNWDIVYPRVREILKKVQNAKVEDSEMLPGIELVGILYLNKARALTLLKDFIAIIPNVRKSSHVHALELFVQMSLSYWEYAHPREFTNESKNETSLSQTCNALFDLIYSYSDESNRSYSTWNFLGLLITFCPQIFEEQENTPFPAITPIKSKLDFRSSKKHPTKKNLFLSLINNNHQDALDPTVLFATYHIIKAGSIFALNAPSSPIVKFAKRMYNVLLPHLFTASSPTPQTLSFDLLQMSFVSSYSILMPEALLRDVYPLMNPKTNSHLLIPNILRGHINLQQIPIFKKYYFSIMEKIFDLARDCSQDFTILLIDFDKVPDSKKTPYELALQNCYVEIVTCCFIIFAANPHYYVKNRLYKPPYTEDPLYTTILIDTLSRHDCIRIKSGKFCESFFLIENLKKFPKEDYLAIASNPVIPTYQQFGHMAMAVCQTLLETDDETRIIAYLSHVKKVITGRNEIIKIHGLPEYCNRDPTRLEPREQRKNISTVIETAMYVCLCSSNTTICNLAFENLSILLNEAVLIEDLTNISNCSWSVVPNFAALAEFSSSTQILAGTMATQKKLYQYLQKIEIVTKPIIKAWSHINKRWHNLTKIILASNTLDRPMIKLWRSYGGFLCSLLSPFLVQDDERVIEDQLSRTSQTFLDEIISMMTLVKSPFLRETARDILSTDTSAISYHFIFKSIQHDIVIRVSKPNGVDSEQDFILLEQSVMLLRSVIGKINEGYIYLPADISTLALEIVKCLDLVNPDERTIRLRIQYCHLLELVASHQDTFNIRHDIAIRNEIANIFTRWLDNCLNSKFTDDNDSIVSGISNRGNHKKREAEYERLQKECICAIVKSLTMILLDLRIMPKGDENSIVKRAKAFKTLFELFLRTLEKCRSEEDGSYSGSLMFGDRLNNVKSDTIECASKLLNANMDVGLKFAIPLSFTEDNFMRVSFTKILNNILIHDVQGSTVDNERQNYIELTDFITTHINITLSLCEVCPAIEVDEFSKALLNMFKSRGKCLTLVKAVVSREIKRADTPIESLRRNCVATKILSIYAHQEGFKYLQATLGSFLKLLVTEPEKYAFETNPDKLPSGDNLESNYPKFDRSVKFLVDALYNSVNEIPPVIKEICHTISTCASIKFPDVKDSSITSVSAFFMLRFLCPALVSPEGEGLLELPPSKEVRRTLLILAKILQNMATGATSAGKISVLKSRNTKFNFDPEKIIHVLQKISEVEYESSDDTSSNLSFSDLTGDLKLSSINDLDILHTFLYRHWEDINHKLIIDQRLKLIQSTMADITTREQDLRASQKLTSLIRNLGRPRSAKTIQGKVDFNTFSSGVIPKLAEFVKRNAHRDMTPVLKRELFAEAIDNDGIPMIIVNCRNYNKDEIDTELVVSLYLDLASKVWNQKYRLFYDITGFTPSNTVPNSVHYATTQIAPKELAANCVGIYFLNISTDYISCLKFFMKDNSDNSFLNFRSGKYKFLTSEDLPNTFNMNALPLNSKTLSTVSDVKIVYNNVYRYNPLKNAIQQVSLRLGKHFLQIKSSESFNFFKNTRGYINDVIEIKDIRAIYKSSTDGHPDEFTIELYRPDNVKIILHCTKSKAIIRAVQNAQESLPKIPGDHALLSSPESCIASLLNIALSGICSSYPQTQMVSYNLLATMQKRFNLDLGTRLHGGKGLRLPANALGYAEKFSTYLAESRTDIIFEFLSEAYTSFCTTSLDRRQGVLIYIRPWMVQLAKIEIDSEETAKSIAAVIRRFLVVSIKGDRDYMYLLQTIWPLILQEEPLIPITLEQLVAILQEQKIVSGPELDDTVSILTSMPTATVCKYVVRRVHRLILEKHVRSNGVVQHPDWNEFVILLSILAPILFENPACAEECLMDISLSIFLFIHTGSYSFRKSLYNLMVNTMQSFTYSKWTTKEGSEHIKLLWKDLTSTKGNMIFGISEEMRYVDYDYPASSLIFQIESCCGFLCDMATYLFNSSQFVDRTSIFVDRCIEISKPKFSVFQGRALLALTCSSRIDVEDKTVYKVLEILQECLKDTEDMAARDELFICVTYTITKLSDGLKLGSKFLPQLFWLAIALMATSNIRIFNYGLQLMQTCLRNLDECGAFRQTSIPAVMMAAIEDNIDSWRFFNGINDIRITEENFEIAITAIMLKGLEKSTTRSSTLSAFETLLTIFAKNSTIMSDNDTFDTVSLHKRNSSNSLKHFDNDYLRTDDMATISSDGITFNTGNKKFSSYFPFLYVLYLGSRSSSELKDYFWLAGYPENDFEDEIPTQVKAFLQSDQTDSILCVYLGVHLFRLIDNEEAVDLRVLSCLMFLGQVNVEKFFKVYFLAREKIQVLIENGPSLEVLKPALDVVCFAVSHLEFLSKGSQYKAEMDRILVQAGFHSLVNMNQLKPVSAASSAGEKFTELTSIVTSILGSMKNVME